MGGISLYLSYDRELDWLMAYEFGRVDDYHLPGAWRGVSEWFGFMLSELGGEEVAVKVLGFSEFDARGEAVAEIWTGVAVRRSRSWSSTASAPASRASSRHA